MQQCTILDINHDYALVSIIKLDPKFQMKNVILRSLSLSRVRIHIQNHNISAHLGEVSEAENMKSSDC
jgi:hypothetical protein